MQPVPAIVAAGDCGVPRDLRREQGLPRDRGRPLVAHVVATLQACPRSPRSGWSATLRGSRARSASPRCAARCASRSTSCRSSATSTRTDGRPIAALLPGAGPDGRDPGPDDADPRCFPLRGHPVRDAAGDLRVRARSRSRRAATTRWGSSPRSRCATSTRGAGRARHPHGLLQPARGALPPEQPAPDPARAHRQSPLHRRDVRAPTPARVRSDPRARLAAAAQRARRFRACSATTC